MNILTKCYCNDCNDQYARVNSFKYPPGASGSVMMLETSKYPDTDTGSPVRQKQFLFLVAYIKYTFYQNVMYHFITIILLPCLILNI